MVIETVRENTKRVPTITIRTIEALKKIPIVQTVNDAVSRDDAVKSFAKHPNKSWSALEAIRTINALALVCEKPRLYWKRLDNNCELYDRYECPHCGRVIFVDNYNHDYIGAKIEDYEYCPICGKMTGGVG